MSDIQAVLFPINGFTLKQIHHFLNKNKLKPLKVHATSQFYRIIIHDPKHFDHFITKKLKNGIVLIIGSYDLKGGLSVSDIATRIRDVVSEREAGIYPPLVRSWIERHKDNRIVDLYVARVPVNSALKNLLNVIDLNNLNTQMKKQNIDKLFHLFAIVVLDNKTNWIIERNEEIQIHPLSMILAREKKEQQTMRCYPHVITKISKVFDTLLEKDPYINFYDPITHNCQEFITLFVNTVCTPSKQILAFINQPLTNLLYDYTKKFSTFVTSAKQKINVLFRGKGNYIL